MGIAAVSWSDFNRSRWKPSLCTKITVVVKDSAVMSFLNTVKGYSVNYGGYKVLRWMQDKLFEPSRMEEFRKRMNFYQQLIRPSDLCFDVGSNIGDISAVLLQIGARVVAIDPQPNAMRELRARLGNNSNLSCLDLGLADAPGTLMLYLHDKVGTTSMIQNWGSGKQVGSIHVDVTTLDDVILKFGLPKYCKIDVEGFEINVLRGLTQRIELLSFEYHSDTKSLLASIECLKVLETYGPITANVVPFGNYQFAWERWKSRSEFEQDFVGGLSKDPAYAYGDIFVRR